MKYIAFGLSLFGICFPCFAFSQITVRSERNRDSLYFQFETIPIPAVNDAAAKAKLEIVKGQADRKSAPLAVLTDGRIPVNQDSPTENFFFAAGTSGGCLAVDLGQSIPISEIASYSWHSSTRAAQVYKLYAAPDKKKGFRWNQPIENDSPTESGWQFLAEVDSRSRRNSAGQHATLIGQESGSLGPFRYLLFEIKSTTDADSPFGNTFFSELDVLQKDAPALKRIQLPEVHTLEFESEDQKYHYSIDLTAAPDLHEWNEQTLKPVILEWYPRIVAMLPSQEFSPPNRVRFRYLPSAQMNGIPAYAQGNTITLNAGWMSRERKREAAGAVVHEMVHVVQAYQGGRRERTQPRTRTPGWLVEGIPDYIRWFLYEPQTQGAELSSEALSKAKHDASYRVSANFIDWVIRNHDPQGKLLPEINAAAREGKYTTDLWEKLTGKTESQLADEWRQQTPNAK